MRSATFSRGFLGGPIGLHDAFSLGKTALQANHQRQIQPHTLIRIRAAIGAAHDLLRLGQIFCKDVGKAEIGQHGRFFGHDLQRACIVLPRFLVSAKLIEHGALGRQNPPIRIVGGVGAAEDVEGLLKIAVVRQRPPIAGKQRLVAGMGDAGLLEHGHRLGLLPVARSALPYWSAASTSLGLARKRSREASRSRRGSAVRLVSVFSPSDPVMSEVPAVWHPHSPNSKIADDGCECSASREAMVLDQRLEHVV